MLYTCWRRRRKIKRLFIMLLPLLVGILLLSPLYFIYKPPSLLIRYFQHRWPDVLWHVQTTKKLVALTIDDAPSPHTNDILHTLQAHDAAATFFLIGSQIPGREGILHDVIRGHNELANHAMHDEPSRSLSDDVLTEEIVAVQGKIREAYGAVGEEVPVSKYFRPGSGFFSDRMRALVRSLGYRLVLGSVYPHDPQIPYSRVNAAHILSMVRPGSIIICHDRRPWTAPMLAKVLPELKRRGYRVVTVTELLKEAAGS